MKKLIHHIIFVIVQSFFYLFGFMPLWILQLLGAVIGILLFILPLRLRYYASANIKLCFPELNFWQLQKLLFFSLIETGKQQVEAPVFWVRSAKHLNKLIKKISGFEELMHDYQQGKGMIFAGGHIGGYYLLKAFLAPRFIDTVWMYKPQKGFIEQLTESLREQFGGRFVPTTREGVMAMLRNLYNGKGVGMSCDHNALETSGVYAPLFGIDVASMTLLPRLAQKSQAPAYFLLMERLSWARGYKLTMWRMNNGIYDLDVVKAATAMNQEVERAIRRVPVQNEWVYRRFWDRPPGVKPLYKTQK
jgi:KDO2-lipid IV(A) lauroyltransferase